MKIKITSEEIKKYLNIETVKFPKYVAPLINLSNQYAQGTRPKVVGQMSELIKEFEGKTIKEWEDWYIKKRPDSIKYATEKIVKKLKELRRVLDKIDEKMVEKWVKDLIIVKTFSGLRFHEAIIKKVGEIKGISYRLAKPEEESKGIDGYIGDIPVSVKPHTFKVKEALLEQINVKVIYYRKIKNGIEVDCGDII